ncbi:MAG: HRDC domain-containing protein, partial [Sciscionella sp.]|nr:HRDC domain-containing protein [Sciscionella sp.]
PPAPRAEPWRRTSGIHRVRNPRGLAAVRALWQAREQIAADRDIAPGRILPDRSIVDAVLAAPTTEAELVALPVFRGRAQRRMAHTWLDALRAAAALPKSQLPESSPPSDGPPPPNRWADRDPDAAARLAAARAGLAEIAETHNVPVENLLLPDLVRRICWQPPDGVDVNGTADALRAGGARPWQVELTSAVLSRALHATAD